MTHIDWFTRPIEHRASITPELGVDGKWYRKGEFMPFFVPRTVMPQVDEKDLPELLGFLKSRGVSVSRVVMHPREIRPHQRIDVHRAMNMSEELLAKPILGSVEPYILDGHHRWFEHDARGIDVTVMKIMLEFEEAIKTLFSFPKTYAYGDGNFHPESS